MLKDIDTSGMSPYRQVEVELAKSACAALTWYYESGMSSNDFGDEIQNPHPIFEDLEKRLDEWSEVQPR